MDYLSAVSELNYMTQIVIMLYEDNNKVKAFVLLYVSCAPVCQCPYSCVCVYICGQDPSSEERFHVELHFSPGVKSCRDEENAPMGFGFRPASSEVCVCV